MFSTSNLWSNPFAVSCTNSPLLHLCRRWPPSCLQPLLGNGGFLLYSGAPSQSGLRGGVIVVSPVHCPGQVPSCLFLIFTHLLRNPVSRWQFLYGVISLFPSQYSPALTHFLQHHPTAHKNHVYSRKRHLSSPTSRK